MTRRVWFARDCWLSADPRIEQLAGDHGPGGVLTWEEILALAKLANEKGVVTVTYAQLSRRAWLKSPAQARAIVSACADLGLLELQSATDGAFSARVGRFARWQVTDPKAAERQRKSRGNPPNGHVNVTDLNRDESVTVTGLQETVDREQRGAA